MPKQNITISVDRNAYDFHKERRSNISAICNDALCFRIETDRPTLEKLKENAQRFDKERQAMIEQFKEAQDLEKADRFAQLRVAGTDYLKQQRELLEADYQSLNRILTRCSLDTRIPRQVFDKAMQDKAKRQGITVEALTGKVFRGGRKQIDKVFKERGEIKKGKK